MEVALILLGVLVSTTALTNGFTKQPLQNYTIHESVARITISCSRREVTTNLAPGESATIQSPNYPSDYDSKSLCKWRFASTTDIAITCSDFLLQSKNRKGKCSDKLTLDGNQFCGSSLLSYSGGDNVLATFKSNKKKHFKGFSCTATAESEKKCVCGKVNRATRILIDPATTTEVNEYPWMVALVTQGGSSSYCGGSLINDRWVLTAAHCTRSGASQVLLGNHLQSQIDAAEMRINVKRVVDHPEYNDRTLDNDFSLLELSTPVDLVNVAPEIGPVCLPSPSNPSQYENVDAIVTGWGFIGGSQSDALREITVRTISNAVCNQQYAYGGSILDSMICVTNSQGDTCQGYSGGPLVHNIGGYFIQIGVVSWGYGCADLRYPGVYSRVTDAISWITSTSSSGSTCAPPS